jgi:hypothetical protein
MTTSTKRQTLNMLHKLNSLPKSTRESLKSEQKQRQLENDHSFTQKRLVYQLDSNDDFLSMILVNVSFHKLLFITKILLQLTNLHLDKGKEMKTSLSYSESYFSDYTPIHIFSDGGGGGDNEGDNQMQIMSFRLYYNMIYDEALKVRNDEQKHQHLKELMKACFLIAFVYDIRVRRFVMARHMIHYKVMKSKPPNRERALKFIEEIRLSFINPFLSLDPSMDIIKMVTCSMNVWIDKYMSTIKPIDNNHRHTTHLSPTNAIDSKA